MKKVDYHRCYGIDFAGTIKKLSQALEKEEFDCLFNFEIKEKGFQSLFFLDRVRFVEICDFFGSDIVYFTAEDIDIKETKILIGLWQTAHMPTTVFNLEKIDELFVGDFWSLKFTMAEIGIPFNCIIPAKEKVR